LFIQMKSTLLFPISSSKRAYRLSPRYGWVWTELRI
jgi:hypothetical protein